MAIQHGEQKKMGILVTFASNFKLLLNLPSAWPCEIWERD